MSVALLLDQAFRLQGEGDFAQAEKLYATALQSVRDNPALWFNHALTLRDLGRPSEALASFDQARRLTPPMAEIENERANALLALDRPDESLAAAQLCVTLRPGHPGGLITRGMALAALSRPNEALADFSAALRLDPHLTLALVHRGATLDALDRPQEALADYSRALAIDPNDCTALSQCGALLAKSGQHAQALTLYERALAIDPGLAIVRLNRATALMAVQRMAEAHQEAKRLFAEHPDNPAVFDVLMETTLRTCDFAQRGQLEAVLPGHIRDGWPLAPFRVMHYSDDPILQRAVCATHVRNRRDARAAPLPARRIASGRRLKLAYLSHDFRNHAVSIFGAGVWARHDRARFEVFAVSTGPDDASPMRRRLATGFEHFLDMRGHGAAAVAARLAREEIDILVDLGGHTTGLGQDVTALRPAPVQVGYLGWAATTANPAIDYLIADAVVAPPGSEGDFTEKLVRLPHCYHPMDPGRDPFGAAVTRAQEGLPEEAFVFCAFNGTWKIAPPLFRLWLELLREVPGSVLWLRRDNDVAERNLRQDAAAAGIAPERLVFAQRADEAAHIARHRLADLFLDTLPFAGHSTAIEALWAGLPVVSCSGNAFASRVSASALQAAGLPELAVSSLPDYRALALALARDPALLASCRETLDKGRATLPLFDIAAYTSSLEAAYETMAARARAGLAPDAFTVER